MISIFASVVPGLRANISLTTSSILVYDREHKLGEMPSLMLLSGGREVDYQPEFAWLMFLFDDTKLADVNWGIEVFCFEWPK